MATVIHHSTPVRLVGPATPRSVTSQQVTSYDAQAEPSRAASVVPVLIAFGALVALALGAAVFGREVVELVGGLLAGE
ncbi:hypothetical protein [Sanguibacter suaedae]|uniref:Uncharacterized protein n=1 Tax=Sanguibacter suaedae TaxID=2795737 RepID=A0A934M8U7_9MICO|nr:hypothetical protein [Sanguibacter suaedae]MBI9113953.1 hypothetical protein [Sanguibacter suaedae]